MELAETIAQACPLKTYNLQNENFLTPHNFMKCLSLHPLQWSSSPHYEPVASRESVGSIHLDGAKIHFSLHMALLKIVHTAGKVAYRPLFPSIS